MKCISTAVYLIVVLILLFKETAAVDYRKEYCNGQEFIGNNGVAYSYPHLHCGSNFFVLSLAYHGHHINLTSCESREDLLQNKHKYRNARKPNLITRTLVRSLC